ncbi:MAG: 6-phosphofructokinase [Proteobacteria bacterium]|nr:6-phosphofructokinase [Pseudomonadota bacterium]
MSRVGIVFSGGPAPAANAVISAAAISFLEAGHDVVGFFHGYSNLVDYHPVTHRLLPDKHYRILTDADLRGTRNSRGILLGTARTNPGKGIRGPEDLADDTRTAGLRSVYTALVDLEIDALISIGGDDTLKTANLLHLWQKTLPASAPRVSVVHLPKTIDNDYAGIDFTFGFFTAVDFMAKEVENLRADAIATSAYFIVETMGRKAGWLSYGVAIAGEADLVIAVEDLDDGLKREDGWVDVDRLVSRIVSLIEKRESQDKHYGTVVIAEGIAEHLPPEQLGSVTRDDHGHISLGKVDLARMLTERVKAEYERKTGQKKGIKPVQLGYESRCAPPHAFDVMLGSQLGIGAYRALMEEKLDGHMVSVTGQLDLVYVPFSNLVDPKTLVTEVRFIQPGSDFHRLARFLETRVERNTWTPGRRHEP